MSLLTNAPRGTQDILPAQIGKWQYVEDTLLRTARLFGFGEIRTPTFEHTELFSRGVGDATDVVQKEMYTFQDKSDRLITLRPEGTAGVVRAAIQNGLLNGALPLRCCYLIPCFRYEKPQAGRLREFHQFGAEVFGPEGPGADAELIALAAELFDTLGIHGLSLRINSIGCHECRADYHDALREYLRGREPELCETCRERLERNPMRVLDCKSPVCADIARGAPKILDFLCGSCAAHFEGLKARLDGMKIPYAIDPRIVRGLDYYTRTVFEFVSEEIGAQGTVLGGGRYDMLVRELGGPNRMPALGFALGLERLLLQMEACGSVVPEEPACDVYIANVGDAAGLCAMTLCGGLRQEGFVAECDCMGRSVKAQMKYADRHGAKYAAVLGTEEMESGECTLKNMRDGTARTVRIGEFVDSVYDLLLERATDGVLDAGFPLGAGAPEDGEGDTFVEITDLLDFRENEE